ncbi:MAG TPA: orotidine-5'-phosphate decarboxylase [Ignavibacteria bacterium]|nr:orotidine-5'-phosphate decarboxylase [Ignavibacteria bacterium]
MPYIAKLRKVIKNNNSNVVIGLDTDVEKIPDFFKKAKDPVYAFNNYIVAITSRMVAGYKINIAFYETPNGLRSLEKLLVNIPSHMIKIADAKRGDIENTSELYARTYFDMYDFDAITAAPYMGEDSIKPFLKRKDKYVYLLALTSNPGGKDFQYLKAGTKYLYQWVIDRSKKWGNNLGYVFGANYEKEIDEFTKKNKNTSLLIPGVGTQHGDASKLLKSLHNKLFLINSSRGIIYSAPKNCKQREFEDCVYNAAKELNSKINSVKIK